MPTNFKGIKTTGNRDYNEDNVALLNDAFRDLPVTQRASLIGSIIEESGANPLAVDGTGAYQGLLQWGKDRYKIKSKDPVVELANQIAYIRKTLNDTTDHKSWTDGGKGSGYKSYRDAYDDFNNPKSSLAKVMKGLSLGYVRPTGKMESYNNRLNVSQQIYDRINAQTGPIIQPVVAQPDATLVVKPIVPIPTQEPIDLNLLHTKAEGGYLDTPTPWNELPISQRAEIMREAVNNGIYNLQDVRAAYHNNLFAGGGYMPSKAIKQRIAEWEGSSMYKAAPDTGKVNRSFEAEAKDFNRVIPASIRAKLSQDQLDALYSYGYNVGMGNLKERVLPTLTNYINGSAGAEDVAS